MQTNILRHPKVINLKSKLSNQAIRLLDSHVSLAVTGLSGSGKTAFITSLVNQLLEIKSNDSLPFFAVANQGRVIGVKRDIQPDVRCNRFAYEEAMQGLSKEKPSWPQSTRGISQVRLLIKYQKNTGLTQFLSETRVLTLDITDYPGEWLLDLPLLNMSYSHWISACAEEQQESARAALLTEFNAYLASVDFNAEADEMLLMKGAKLYAEYLRLCMEQGFKLIQPGRFVLPGEWQDAPVLHFFPVSDTVIAKQNLRLNRPQPGSNLELLIQRFESYKKEVVGPFYQQYFKRFDRQIILVDCLSALNTGPHSFADLQNALNWIMKSFDYGKNSLIGRLFKPKIDRLVFAASKADHVTPDQQQNLIKLLNDMVHSIQQTVQFEQVKTESTAIASIRASISGKANVNGELVDVLKGFDSAKGQSVTLYPGEVPSLVASYSQQSTHQFAFPYFSPPNLGGRKTLPHIRVDQVLEFLLSDKLS